MPASLTDIYYACYRPGIGVRNVRHEALVKLNQQEGVLFARVENSGSEGMYVEIARWSDKQSRWCRFAFTKLFDGEYQGLSAKEACQQLANEINCSGENIPLVSRLPEWR